MKPIRLYLLRHGNTFNAGDKVVQVGLKTDLPLTERGREQAERAAVYLDNKGIQTIYCGSLLRQTETAEIVGKKLGVSVQRGVDALNEIDYGAWEGLSSDEIATKSPEAKARWADEAHFPEDIFRGSEASHLESIEAFVASIRQTTEPGQAVLAVSSGGIIRYFHSFLRSEWDKLKKEKAMSYLKVGTGQLCALEVHPYHVSYLSWAYTP